MAEISVVIPVYNVEKYLTECLDSLLAQTFTDWEAICVNDGSKDSSLSILQQYAEKDCRIRILDQDNSGAAASRNNGMKLATGRYWIFLDSDDRFLPKMLQSLYENATATDAEVTMCAYDVFDSNSGNICYRFFYPEYMSVLNTFSLKEKHTIPLQDFQPAPWVYLYQADYIRKLDLRFQDLPRSNDLFFTRAALLHADRLAIVNKVLVNYRVGMTTNLQSGNSKSPLAFLQAMYALADYLKKNELFTIYKTRFAIDLLRLCEYNLSTQKNESGFTVLFEEIRQSVLPCYWKNINITEIPEKTTAFYQRISQAQTPIDYFILWQKDEQIIRNNLYAEIEKQSALYEAIKNSGSYKIGRFILTPLDWIRRLFR